MNTQNTNTVIEFEVGNVYAMKFIGDSDLQVAYICVKRTPSTVVFEEFMKPENGQMKRRVKQYDGVEYVLDGNYSMAPRIKADKIIA